MNEYQMTVGGDIYTRRVYDGLDEFTKAYVECMFWTSDTDGDLYKDRAAEFADLTGDALTKIIRDCAQFQDRAAEFLNQVYENVDWYEPKQAGHDFWLTRNRHGAGFWDRDLNKTLADVLTKFAHDFGETSLYCGDDGKLYMER